MPDQDFERLVAAQLANEGQPWSQRVSPPAWATEPTPEQLEAMRQQEERVRWTQEAEHATATPLQRLLRTIGITAASPSPSGDDDKVRKVLQGLTAKRQEPPRPPVVTNPLAVLGTPGAAFAAGAGALIDRPGDLGAAGRAALGEAQRAPFASSVSELASPSGELTKRDIPVPGGNVGGLVLDVGMDPTNLIGGEPFTDIAKLGVAGAAGAGKLASAAALPFGPDVIAALKRLFPKLDAYSKPTGLLSGQTILKRGEAATDLSPEVREALSSLAAQVGDRRVQPLELHALAEGEKYTPERVLRKPRLLKEGEKQIPGAPLGVTNARQARALREDYLDTMEQGVKGRDWYHDSGESILFHANDDPDRARRVAGTVAITSPATSVDANTGMALKGYNQGVTSTADDLARQAAGEPTMGEPIAAGRFPTAMGKNIAALLAGGEESLGLKRDPFAQNIAMGGGFHEQQLSPGVFLQDAPKLRAVHDIWDAEAHGYINPDGSPMRVGFGPAQHRFMDQQQDKIIATANQRQLGGFDDWEELRSQAAGWTGAKNKAEAAKGNVVDPDAAAKSVADFLPEHYAQGHREFAAGETTDHMPELLNPNTPHVKELRREWADRILQESKIFDPKMRDQITAAFEGLVGRSFEGPGYFKGQTSPGAHTRVLTGSKEATEGLPGARVLDEGSKKIMDAAEAVYSILLAQDAGAYTRLMAAGSGAARTGWDVALKGGMLTEEQMLQMAERLKGSNLIPIPTPQGVRLIYGGNPLSEPSRQPTFKFLREDPTVKKVLKDFGGTLQEAGAPRGNYFENDWRQQRVGQDFFDFVRNHPRGPELFSENIPPLAQNMRELQARFIKDTRGRVTANPIQDEIRGTIANEGWPGLERLAKKYAGDGPLVQLAQKYQVSLFTLMAMMAGVGGSTALGQEEAPQMQ